jgi:RimJ/RimL family protein N-acetyltransferase
MRPNNIHTVRLTLIPVTYEITSTLIKGSSEEIEKLGITAHSNWPTEDTKDVLPSVNDALEETRCPSGFEFWMIVNKESREIIGDIGFHGKPDENGVVEIGYGLVLEERGKGYGFEAADAILEWTMAQEEVKVIKADCLIDNTPSVRILEKLGMRETGRDEEFIFWEVKKGYHE